MSLIICGDSHVCIGGPGAFERGIGTNGTSGGTAGNPDWGRQQQSTSAPGIYFIQRYLKRLLTTKRAKSRYSPSNGDCTPRNVSATVI